MSKNGTIEVLIAAVLLVIQYLVGSTLLQAAVFVVACHAFFAVAASLINFVGLAPSLRQGLSNPLFKPYSSLGVTVPLALMSPAIHQLARHHDSTSMDPHDFR